MSLFFLMFVAHSSDNPNPSVREVVEDFRSARTGLIKLSHRGSVAHVWFDANQPMVSLDLDTPTGTKVRYHWDGTLAWRHQVGTEDPEELPGLGSWASQVWTWARTSALPDTWPSGGLPRSAAITLPDGPLPLRLDVGSFVLGEGWFRLYRTDTGQRLSISGVHDEVWAHVEYAFDRPIRPGAYGTYPVRGKVIIDRRSQAGRPETPGSYPQDLTTSLMKRVQGDPSVELTPPPCVGSEKHVEAASARWLVEPSEVDKINAALASCQVVLSANGWGRHFNKGAETCLRGRLRVLKRSDGSVVAQSVTRRKCVASPTRVPVEVGTPMQVELPSNIQIEKFRVEFEGEVEVNCSGPTEDGSAVSISYGEWDQPLLSWSDCYPGWSFD